MTSPPPSAEQTVLFRPSKKRKLYRHRETTSPLPDAPAQSLDELIATSSSGDGTEGTSVSLAEILRLRKQRRLKIGAVEFRAEDSGREREGEEEREEEVGAGVVRRFAPQTGLLGKGDVDRHMTAFIDSELAKRRQEGLTAAQLQSPPPPSSSSHTELKAGLDVGYKDKNKEADVQRQPAALGKLLEIDLGDEARHRNVERTNQARRRLDGEAVEDEEVPKGKVRLGRDGKPWRGRKRRGSDDIKRDKLVEDILRENRLEIYDEPPVEPTTVSDDQAADDRIAEAFRKEFMDAVSQRQRKKAVSAQPPARGPGGKKEEELKGPKLGGSRSARAAMRETLLKNAKK